MVLKTMKESEDRCENMTSHMAEKYKNLKIDNVTLKREKSILEDE